MSSHPRDQYLDALRAGALLVVVFGHWIATLPRLVDGRMVATEHLLDVWQTAGVVTWIVQVVPLFVFVSAAVSADGVSERGRAGHQHLHWWAGRALGLARPTVTYLAAIAVFVIIAMFTGGRLMDPLNHSLTVHLWFLAMLLIVQAMLPLSVEADRRFGLGAVLMLVAMAAVVDIVRAGPTGPAGLLELGQRTTASPGGIGWLNALIVWLIPQQLGIAWRRGRFRGAWVGAGLVAAGLVWLAGSLASGYPVAMIGIDLEGRSNMLPPTLALIGVMCLQAGAVLLVERPARWLLEQRSIGGLVAMLGALSMPLYLWHKLAELPAAWLGERLGLPIDAGVPGEAGFWAGRLWWVGLCIVMVVPVIAAVVNFELRRTRNIVSATATWRVLVGGSALLAAVIGALVSGAMPGALFGLALVVIASRLLRARNQPDPDTPLNRSREKP